MRKRFLLLLLFIPFLSYAQNWDYIQTSGEYYYGEGHGSTEAEADNHALSILTGQIATHVSNDFTQVDDQITVNGEIDHKSRVLNCVKTYSHATLTNAERWVIGKEPNVTVRRYLKCSELQRIYQTRIEKAKGMVEIADECLKSRKVDMALQYYYWAYSLIRSVQFPNEVKGTDGRILVDVLPIRIRGILDAIRVEYESRQDERVNLRFYYDGQPVSSLEFTYSDGRSDKCEGTAKDGRGSIEMAPGHEDRNVFHIHVNYEYIEQARGDAEMESVLNVITKKVIPQAGFKVEARGGRSVASTQSTQPSTSPARKPSKSEEGLGMKLQPGQSQVVADMSDYADIMQQVVEAARTRNLSNVDRYFTVSGGLPRYRTLLKTGAARVVGTPNIVFFKGVDGQVVARGLQMSLTYNSRGRKKTFVEDVVFTFNADKKIENVTFGLGQLATNDILCKHPKWNDETKELLMEFLENYKTAYCMKDSAYIRQIFSDDAVIIIGKVVKTAANNPVNREHAVSLKGQQVITYNRYTKDEYLRNLRRCFDRNEFINLRFTNNEIQRLEKFQDKELFGIQIGQEYSSSTYSDVGYLFLLADLTNHALPQIKIRTWQPNEVNMDSLYHAGYFYDN